MVDTKPNSRKSVRTKSPTAKRMQQLRKGMLGYAHQIVAGLLFTLAILMLCVSMPHLTQGIQRITGSSTFTAILMAITYDLSQVICEICLILVPILHVQKKVITPCKAVIVVCTLVSMILNVDAFLQHAENTKAQVLATVWGILLPLGVLTLSYIGSAFVLNNQEP